MVGAPDDRYGERVCAFVRLRPGSDLSLDDVARHFASTASPGKTPEQIIPVDDFPRTATGKVRKADLRAQLRRGLEGDLPDVIVG